LITHSLKLAIEAVPAGAWAVGVSGGVDSVALLELLRTRGDLSLHVVHLNHQTRGKDSDQDADFVAQLSSSSGLPATIARLSELDQQSAREHANKSARFRAARFALFRRTVQIHHLRGVILAHHADDQAETILQRLLRGSGAGGLGGMSPEIDIGSLVVLRPLLGVPKAALREMLIHRGLAWREDASNSLPNQQRNRVRQLLENHPPLTPVLLELAGACRAMTNWMREQSPVLAETFDVAALRDLPAPLARTAAHRWLMDRTCLRCDIPPGAIERLLTMANDAASPARQNFPGNLLVRRRTGKISALSAHSSAPSQESSPARSFSSSPPDAHGSR